ncbi:MAG TPA: hypothetical protein VGQ57_14470 [Polyangiaceae bacterium]|jgi:hypothetical protein|nr:hypothetical protein [Polyangiaceae bacterium]
MTGWVATATFARPRRAFLLAGLASAWLFACDRSPRPPEVRATFGVFFGGQIQDRQTIPLILDRARQSVGVRLEFAEPPAADRRVEWELDRPAGKKPGDTSRVVAFGQARARAGEAVLDVPLAFQPNDRPGTWRVRVVLDGQRVLDRAFTVTPASDAPSNE